MSIVCKCDVEYEIYNYIWDKYYSIKMMKNFQKQIINCKTVNQFLNMVINYIKDEIIRQYPCFEKFKIEISSVNYENIYHRIMVSINEIMALKLNIHEINYNKSLVIIIWYETELVFITSVNFDKIILK